MLKITRLRITIEPWHVHGVMNEFRVESIVNGNVYTTVIQFENDDFESRFDYLMDQARRDILRLVKTNHE